MSEYFTLLTSLPHLPRLGESTLLPISRLALERRLTMLSEPDAAQMALVESIYFSDYAQLALMADKQIVTHWHQQLEKVESETLKARLVYQLELRTLLAALRYRDQGDHHPEQFSGMGRWGAFIKQHWYEPFFTLDSLYPQLQTVAGLSKQGKIQKASQLLDQMLWQDLFMSEKQQGFCFDAIACYVLRWGLIDRATREESTQALSTFEQQIDTLLSTTSFANDDTQEPMRNE